MIPNELITLCWYKGFRAPIRSKADDVKKILSVHSSKVKPTEILNRFRPNERPEHKKYREDVYEPNTYGTFNKVLTQFKKIRLAEDWQIKWPDTVKDNPLRAYCDLNYPKYDSLENWLFDYQLKRIVEDPNGVICFYPENLNEVLVKGLQPDKAFRPRAYYWKSEYVQLHSEQFLVLKYQEGKTQADGTLDKKHLVNAMLFFDADQIIKVKAKGDKETDGVEQLTYTHKFGWNPVLANGGIIAEDSVTDGEDLLVSFIDPALAAWNEAIEAESDHKVDKALHLHPDRWEIQNETCNAPGCKDGKIRVPGFGRDTDYAECKQCQGSGKRAAKSPFGVMGISAKKIGPNETLAPVTPPAGYIERPLESIKLTKEYADKKIVEGLAAINLEFLAESPLNQSGTAKEYDRQEIYAYVGDVAKHLVNNILKNAYFFCNLWLQPHLSEAEREKYLPTINTPAKFDLITADVWAQRLKAAKENGTSAASRARAEIKAAEKQYGADSIDFLYVRDSIQLDPLYGMDPTEKTDAVLNNGCSQLDYIISTQVNYFIRRAAIESNDKFFTMDYPDKIKKLKQYAEETRKEASVMNTSFTPEVEKGKQFS